MGMDGGMKRITRVGVVSFAKVGGMSGVLMGLIIGAIYALFGVVIGIIGLVQGKGEALMAIVFGVIALVAVPIIYGIMTFVISLIYGLILNLVLGMAGGLELEIQDA